LIDPESNETAAPQATPSIEVRPATLDDLNNVQALLRPYVLGRKLLKRSRSEMVGLLGNGFVAAVDKPSGEFELVGFCAVEIYSRKLAEIQCLAVRDGYQGRGLGSQLVKMCVNRARERGVLEVMAISASEGMFRNIGFDYSLPDQKRALFYQLKTREEMYNEMPDEEL
jgi:amino-acid N-acetyltransferase